MGLDMVVANSLPIRPSLSTLQQRYDAGDKKPLEDLICAWRGIKSLPASGPRSFFVLGGYHGEPFQYRKTVDALSPIDSYAYWGGYCNHGNVLFPTWHRAYLYALEKALQSIVPGVMLPYWDETSEAGLASGIPSVLTDEFFELDGEQIENPLRSFTLPVALSDSLPGDSDAPYDKSIGYETVRYPLSGLVGTPEARSARKRTTPSSRIRSQTWRF
jgi:tyrosinase